MKVAVIDYNAGNLANVERAVCRAGMEPVVTRDEKIIHAADAMILPGVGAMKDAMEEISRFHLPEIIRSEVKAGKKLLGICLGMQALFDVSEEGGEVPCLGFIPGRVVEFPKGALKVPHMGWNELNFRKNSFLQKGLPPHPYVYFVHSYYKTPADAEDVVATCDYGRKVTAISQKDNVLGFQFHPEKSGPVGEVLWKNIAEWFSR